MEVQAVICAVMRSERLDLVPPAAILQSNALDENHFDPLTAVAPKADRRLPSDAPSPWLRTSTSGADMLFPFVCERSIREGASNEQASLTVPL